MSYSYVASDIVSLAKLYAFGGADEIAYPSDDVNWYAMLSAAWRSRVYPRLLNKGGESWFYKTAPASITAGSATYPLSGTAFVSDGDFHRLKQFQIDWGDYDKEAVRPLEPRERPRIGVAVWGRYEYKRWELRGNVLELLPAPTSSESVTLTYVPTAPDLSYSTATISGPEGVDEALALELAVRARAAQNEDTRDQRMDLAQAYERLDIAAGAHRQDDPPRIVDTNPEGYGDPLDEWTFFREPRA